MCTICLKHDVYMVVQITKSKLKAYRPRRSNSLDIWHTAHGPQHSTTIASLHRSPWNNKTFARATSAAISKGRGEFNCTSKNTTMGITCRKYLIYDHSLGFLGCKTILTTEQLACVARGFNGLGAYGKGKAVYSASIQCCENYSYLV